jgi:putative transposase
MPNHGHFLLWPVGDDELSTFMQRLPNTHAQRRQHHRHLVGRGHVYQGRFKSFPVEEDEYHYQVLRYIERNALGAALVERAEDWRWSSLSSWRPRSRTRFGRWPDRSTPLWKDVGEPKPLAAPQRSAGEPALWSAAPTAPL